ncbi:OmpA family protein [Vibrio sp. D404a]|uniref:OmpA family protein n=1 Tax=unclassified Vibrio TaxID=2614977 RepID=UPI002553DB8F|nr:MULTISPECIES: OmpA family protein [unclassified Vibrio]MDK9738432.1 OmpA family protein [Vibrio sp. D404a]MDK9796204.1 OmpA family protein [Vibrio sp. D449a]
MKYLALIFSLALVGCETTNSMAMLGGNMLETAPQTDYDVMHPEWGVVQETRVVTNYQQAKRSTQTTITTNYGVGISTDDPLEVFLRQNRIDYEVLPGNHVMVKLNHHVNFKTGSATPAPVNDLWLDTLGSYLSQRSDIDIVIEGHTDNTGNDQINDPLSEKRAKEVKARLERNYVSSQSIYTRGFGEYVPACTNNSSQGKACNRRVELMLIVAK